MYVREEKTLQKGIRKLNKSAQLGNIFAQKKLAKFAPPAPQKDDRICSDKPESGKLWNWFKDVGKVGLKATVLIVGLAAIATAIFFLGAAVASQAHLIIPLSPLVGKGAVIAIGLIAGGFQ